METQTKKQQQNDQRATVASEYLLVWDWKSAKKRSKQQKTTANSTKKSVEYTAIIINKAMLEELLYRRFCTAKWFHVWTQSFIPSLMIAVRFFSVFRTNQAIVYCSIQLNGGSLLFYSIRWRCETPTSLVEFTVFLWSFPCSDYAECVLVRALIALYAIWSESF